MMRGLQVLRTLFWPLKRLSFVHNAVFVTPSVCPVRPVNVPQTVFEWFRNRF